MIHEAADFTPPAISAWPLSERPRERLLAKGAQSLSDAELLAILLRTGRKGLSAVELSRQLLGPGKGLAWLNQQAPAELIEQKYLGTVATCTVVAALELGRRVLASELKKGQVLDRHELVSEFLKSMLAHQPVESFFALFLDAKNQLIEHRELFRGSVRHAVVYPREIARAGLELRASSILIAHNHPSGVCEPSVSDRAITKAVAAALETVDIRLVDHVVVTHNHCFSFAQHGML